jgi:tetratricopeptide (TPR) repeat protein
LKSPIWLKDKGDELLQNGDYISAIDAYNSSLRLDPNYWPALSNRSICNLKLHNIEDCMADCNLFLSKVFELQKNNQMTPMAISIREKVYLRTLICYAMKGEFGHYEELAKLLIQEKFLQDSQKKMVKKDLEKVTLRKEAILKKDHCDQLLKDGQYKQAAESYREVIEAYPEEALNERLLSNLSLCELKLDNSESCVKLCSQAIDLIQKKLSRHFAQYEKSKHNEYYRAILVKSYYRKAQSFFKSGLTKECEENLREILLIDEKNEEARSLKRDIEKRRNFDEAQSAKTNADGLLKDGNNQEALEEYKVALTKYDQMEQPVEYASVLLNMTICHTALDQVDEVISDCIKGLRVTAKQSRAVIKFEKTRLTLEEQNKLTQLELRFYMRKGNAFLKKGQIYHAKADFEEAMKLAPDNKEIRQSLDKIAML